MKCFFSPAPDVHTDVYEGGSLMVRGLQSDLRDSIVGVRSNFLYEGGDGASTLAGAL